MSMGCIHISETSLLEGNMQARVKEMHTKLDETVTDEKTIMCHIISEGKIFHSYVNYTFHTRTIF